jgi:hypothetical protein
MQAPLVDERSVQQEGETPALHRLTPGNTTPEEDDAGCKQLIPQYLVVAAMSTTRAYDTPTKSLLEIVAASQEDDPFVQGQEWRRKDSAATWTIDTKQYTPPQRKGLYPRQHRNTRRDPSIKPR